MNNTIKVMSVEENGIVYTYYDAKRKEFFYVESDHAVVFNRENTRMFILDVDCKNIDDFENLMMDFFACDEIKTMAK